MSMQSYHKGEGQETSQPGSGQEASSLASLVSIVLTVRLAVFRAHPS